jgi:hypothetical protein
MIHVEYSLHAQQNVEKRAISNEWVMSVLYSPDRIIVEADEYNNTHYLKQI